MRKANVLTLALTQVKIMELIASMNSRLFDALPALLTEEISASPDFDGKALEASSLGVSLVRGMWQTITSSFSALKGQYTRLGQLLGTWAKCTTLIYKLLFWPVAATCCSTSSI